MNKKLWQPSNNLKKNSNLFRFEKFISKKFHKNFNKNYKKIHNWSIKHPEEFWSSFWDFSNIKGHKSNNPNKFHIRLKIKSEKLKKMGRIESNKFIYKLLDKEMKDYIHSLQILFF